MRDVARMRTVASSASLASLDVALARHSKARSQGEAVALAQVLCAHAPDDSDLKMGD